MLAAALLAKSMVRTLLFNYFKHVPDDLVINSTPGRIISLLGTMLMGFLFVSELRAYLTLTSSTTLVVDELNDELLRANFNVTLHQVPCEFLAVDVSDMTGTSRHNITKDILKWRLDAQQRVIGDAMAVSAQTSAEAAGSLKHDNHEITFDERFDDPEDYEPLDANLSQPLTAESFVPFMQQHELTLVNFFAPWCVWCRRLEPVYLDAASKVPDLHFHGHARLSQVDCVDQQAFCTKNMIRAYPTLRMYKDADPEHFELFTGARTSEEILGFVQKQMDSYRCEIAAYIVPRRGLHSISARFTFSISASCTDDGGHFSPPVPSLYLPCTFPVLSLY